MRCSDVVAQTDMLVITPALSPASQVKAFIRGGVALLGLQSPDEAGGRVGRSVHRVERFDESRQLRVVQRFPKPADVHLRQLPNAHGASLSWTGCPLTTGLAAWPPAWPVPLTSGAGLLQPELSLSHRRRA